MREEGERKSKINERSKVRLRLSETDAETLIEIMSLTEILSCYSLFVNTLLAAVIPTALLPATGDSPSFSFSPFELYLKIVTPSLISFHLIAETLTHPAVCMRENGVIKQLEEVMIKRLEEVREGQTR